MRFPSLYQNNTRILLHDLGKTLDRRATLDDLPDSLLDELAEKGFEWVWLLGVWQTGAAGRTVALSDPGLRAEYSEALPDWREKDVYGSPFAVKSYTVNEEFGGDDALAGARERMARRGIHLLLDFVVNHCALDHPWVQTHPEYFIRGSEEDLAREPQNYTRVETGTGP